MAIPHHDAPDGMATPQTAYVFRPELFTSFPGVALIGAEADAAQTALAERRDDVIQALDHPGALQHSTMSPWRHTTVDDWLGVSLLRHGRPLLGPGSSRRAGDRHRCRTGGAIATGTRQDGRNARCPNPDLTCAAPRDWTRRRRGGPTRRVRRTRSLLDAATELTCPNVSRRLTASGSQTPVHARQIEGEPCSARPRIASRIRPPSSGTPNPRHARRDGESSRSLLLLSRVSRTLGRPGHDRHAQHHTSDAAGRYRCLISPLTVPDTTPPRWRRRPELLAPAVRRSVVRPWRTRRGRPRPAGSRCPGPRRSGRTPERDRARFE